MMKVITIFLVLCTFGIPALAKDNNRTLEDVIRDEFGEEQDKGKGRPDNPGQHGRDNAAEKQSNNPGKGSKSDDSLEDWIRGDDDDKDKDKDKDKKNKKDKNKK